MNEIQLCPAGDLEEGGVGFRFKVLYNGDPTSAFVVRTDGVLAAYLNRCSHVPVELDWNYGEFLEESGTLIVCATHGATYEGSTGHCIGGPCDGEPLVALKVQEKEGFVFWTPDEMATIPPDGIED